MTERKEDAIQLAAIPDLERSVGNAAERAFAPAIIRNLLIVSSRIHGAKNTVLYVFFKLYYFLFLVNQLNLLLMNAPLFVAIRSS